MQARFQAHGPPMRNAKRLEGRCLPGTVLVSQTVALHLESEDVSRLWSSKEDHEPYLEPRLSVVLGLLAREIPSGQESERVITASEINEKKEASSERESKVDVAIESSNLPNQPSSRTYGFRHKHLKGWNGLVQVESDGSDAFQA
jgi:hypothetical protein